ncbi:MAG: PadR family transcriptional regulator [Candidatus Thorarchaeota archaeon]
MNDTSEEPQCCPPDCCDMRGFLTFQIMWELRNGKLNGQQIADKIWQRRGGNRPTPGTIYPALKDLKERNLIHGEKEGNQVVYHLTKEGVSGLEEAARYFYQAFGDIVEESKKIVIRIGDCGC